MSISFDLVTQDALRSSVPLWLAGLGELIVERSGVINIGIEGMMLAGALAAWAATMATGSVWIGLAAAVAAGLLLAGLFAIATLIFDADQVVAGTAINLLAVGATGMGFKLCLDAGLADRRVVFFGPWDLSGLGLAALNQFGLFFATVGLAFLAYGLLRYTRWGIELTALGAYPKAPAAAGLWVNGRRALCVLVGGALAALAGSYLSIMFNTQFSENMTAGRGFLALAMVIFGRWHPLGLLGSGLLFGYIYAVANYLEVSPVSWLPSPQLLQMMPYVFSLVVLAGLMGRARAPAALGRPFERA